MNGAPCLRQSPSLASFIERVTEDPFPLSKGHSLNIFDILPCADGDTAIFTLLGEIETLSAEELRNVVFDWIQAGYRKVILDLNQVSYIDSIGLKLFVEILRALEPDGFFALVGCSDPLKRVLTITGLDMLVPIYESEEAARLNALRTILACRMS
jgi:anti-sigma B factor antagonist